ncbi:Plasmid stabilization system protein ParE [Nitrosomonas marina]|uniref:Plasmid stabilization system protein ParE n=1 Tax=Nitrosomonas marina TaxID=917 RepID=A0A1I0FXQ6_9PROT|nr:MULTISPECIES: type II toxin-antitoxin system RelE/ParE family toxin [Nitrosomonas]MCB1950311.1 type II toxin-antitoxin system RelE/ParE family toxin [Nitrosomonas sp.]SET63071.1 Plasmid stabilization system protein ParE [Nitrosomonas marina]
MKQNIYFRTEAEKDIKTAAAWYEKQNPGLGGQFLDEIQMMCTRIAANPSMFPIMHRKTHRAIIRRFPFGIFYRIEKTSIVVVAVMHASRHPEKWQTR